MASTRQIIRLDGLKEAEANLIEFAEEWGPKKVKPLLTRVLKKEGQVIADAEGALAPKLTGQLAISPAVSTKLSRRQKKLNKKESDVEVYIGPTPHPKSVQTEFGNAHQAAHPHLRPAWDGNVMKVLDGIKDRLTDEIAKSSKRFARKAARLAAKLNG